MNPSPPNNLEQDLTQQLRLASAPYRRALAILADGAGPAPGAPDWNAALTRLQPVMRQIQELEGTLSPLRESWIQSGRRGGQELKGLLAEHRQLLESLLSRIDALETRLRARRGELQPQVDQFLRHRQMQKAYRA